MLVVIRFEKEEIKTYFLRKLAGAMLILALT